MRLQRRVLLVMMAMLSLSVAATALAGGLALPNGTVLQGEAISVKGSKWASTIRITSMNDQTGYCTGEISWPTLNSVHKIEGYVKGSTLVFKETAFIRQGQAHLNVEYALVYDGQTLQGRYVEPGADTGTATYTIQR